MMPLHLMPVWLIRAEHGGGEKIFQHSLHPWRDILCTLSGYGHFLHGIASSQFPLDMLHLHWQFPFSESEVLLPRQVGKSIPHLPEFLWDGLEKEHHLSGPISLSIPLLDPSSLLEVCTQTKGGLDSHSACTQTEGWLGCHPVSTQTEGLGYHPSLKLLW